MNLAGQALYCCQGEPAPQPVVDGWTRYASFPPEARAEFWGLVVAGVAQPDDPQNRARIEALCQRFELSEPDAVLAAQACGFLLGSASAAGLAVDKFQSDLVALSNGAPAGIEEILANYENWNTELRKVSVLQSISDHGKVFVGLDWRVDRVSASNRGVQLDTDVVLLNFRYREGQETGSVSIQFTPEGLKEFRQFMQRFEL